MKNPFSSYICIALFFYLYIIYMCIYVIDKFSFSRAEMRGLTFYKTKQNKYNKHPKKSIVRKKSYKSVRCNFTFLFSEKKRYKYIKIGSKRTKKR